jgi:hypothetical protein
MAYSRKRYWVALGAGLALVAGFALIPPPHPAVITMVFVLACSGLAFLAYFSLDEIQRQNEMRAWYYGGPLAVLFGLLPFMLLAPNDLLVTMAGLMPNTNPIGPDMYSPKTYFRMGVAMAFLVQAIGYFIARTFFSVAERARG